LCGCRVRTINHGPQRNRTHVSVSVRPVFTVAGGLISEERLTGSGMSEANTDRGTFIRWFLAIMWSVLFLYGLVVLKPGEAALVSLANSWSQRLGLPPGSLAKIAHVAGYVLWVFLLCGVIGGGYRQPLRREVPRRVSGTSGLSSVPARRQPAGRCASRRPRTIGRQRRSPGGRAGGGGRVHVREVKSLPGQFVNVRRRDQTAVGPNITKAHIGLASLDGLLNPGTRRPL